MVILLCPADPLQVQHIHPGTEALGQILFFLSRKIFFLYFPHRFKIQHIHRCLTRRKNCLSLLPQAFQRTVVNRALQTRNHLINRTALRKLGQIHRRMAVKKLLKTRQILSGLTASGSVSQAGLYDPYFIMHEIQV